jgi:hypothetical protein
MLLQKSITYNIMITATTAKGTKVNVSLCDDVAPNKGGYYCEVYLDGIDDDPIDNFVISADDMVYRHCRVEDGVYEYINGVTEY